MPLATSVATEALAYTLASLRGLTPDEAVASALRAELEREGSSASHTACHAEEPAVAELMARIHRLGPWQGPSSTQLTNELYDAEGLPA
jgi:hypothetical protein